MAAIVPDTPLALTGPLPPTGSPAGHQIVIERSRKVESCAMNSMPIGPLLLEGTLIRSLWRGFGLLALLSLLAPVSSADCAKNRSGEVYCGAGSCLRDRSGVIWCSRFYEGGAQLTREGGVLCGKGQCVRDSRGKIYCSSVTGGAALKDSRGRVRCYGQCRPANAGNCENTLAGSSD